VVSLSLLTSPVLGPPHLHQRAPQRCHFLGDVSPQGEPVRYMQAVRSLYAWYCQHSEGTGQQRWPPLVVNTHGWIQVGRVCSGGIRGRVHFPSFVLVNCQSSRPQFGIWNQMDRSNLVHLRYFRMPQPALLDTS